MENIKLILLLCFLSKSAAYCNDDGGGNGQEIDSKDVPEGQYDIIRLQLDGECDDEGISDMNPCQTVTIDGITIEFCLEATAIVQGDKLDLTDISVVTSLFTYGMSDSITEDGQGIAPLHSFIIRELGSEVYEMESKDKEDCYTILTISKV